MSGCRKPECLCRMEPIQEEIDRPLDETWRTLDWESRLGRVIACIRSHPIMKKTLEQGRNIQVVWKGRKPRRGKWNYRYAFQENKNT